MSLRRSSSPTGQLIWTYTRSSFHYSTETSIDLDRSESTFQSKIWATQISETKKKKKKEASFRNLRTICTGKKSNRSKSISRQFQWPKWFWRSRCWWQLKRRLLLPIQWFCPICPYSSLKPWVQEIKPTRVWKRVVFPTRRSQWRWIIGSWAKTIAFTLQINVYWQLCLRKWSQWKDIWVVWRNRLLITRRIRERLVAHHIKGHDPL